MDANLAVLIDFENVAAGTEKEGLGRFDIDAVLERVKDKGRVLVARSYADWGRFARFKQGLLKANVTMYELTSHGMHDKNRADIAMVVDALELAFTRDYIDTFVIVSGDSDFTPLVLKMREMNKRIVGIGTRSSTSRLLIQACDEFIFYDSIVAHKKKVRSRSRARSDAPSSKQAAFALLVEAVEGLLRESSNTPNGSVVKGAILRRSPDFSEGDYGFSSWTRFLEAGAKANSVKLSKNDKAGGYFVDVVDGNGDIEPDVDIEPQQEGPWVDPYCPNGMEWVIEALAKEGYNPLSAPTRLAVLECLESVVNDRDGRKRRNNIQFVREDVRRRIAKTHSDLPASALRSVFDALMNAHVFMHRDGTPVRTASAPFNLDKSAEQMNTLLTNQYLEALRSIGADLSNTRGLADIFLGNPERERSIQEILAWLEQPSDVDLLAIDDLLEIDDDDDRKPASKKPRSDAKKPAAKKPAAKKTDDTDDDIDDDDLLVTDDDDDDDAPAAKKAPAKKKPAARKKAPVRKKPAAKKTDDADDTDDDDDLLVSDDDGDKKAPAKKKPAAKKKAPAKKPAAKKPAAKKKPAKKADDSDDDDALLVEDSTEDKPARKPRRRRTTKKPAEDKADDDAS